MQDNVATDRERELLKGIFDRCTTDKTFRERLLAEPRKVIAEAGIELILDPGVALIAIDTPPGALVIPIPPLKT